MERVRFISQSGKQILLIDMSNLPPDEVVTVINSSQAVIARQERGTVLTLTDVTGAQYDRTTTDRLKDYVAHNKPFVRAGAVVGLNELKRIIFNFLNRATGRNLKAFDTLELAKNWLALQ
jgi:hypothetical protein